MAILPLMKNIFTVTLLSLSAILFVTACTPAPRTPVDDVVKPDKNTLEQQKAFDEAMMKKNGINK